jgi:DnaJ domain
VTQTAVNQNGAMPQSSEATYYSLLGLHPSASVIDIRRAYRELSKRYHPDTTDLPTAIATLKFQQINEAYATLSHPERRLSYDSKIRYSRFAVIQPPPDLNRPVSRHDWSKSAYLDPSDRPLSSGEIFALFMLVLTFVGCLLLAVAIGLTRGDAAFQTHVLQSTPSVQQQINYVSQLITFMVIKN